MKGPELLSRYVGDTEASIRALFAQARAYKENTGKTAVIFFDEADSILPRRGSGVSTDVFNTIVPAMLTEMDGLSESSVLVILAANRQDLLDSAVVRDGRVDVKIKVSPPSQAEADEILGIHLARYPQLKDLNKETALDSLFSPDRKLYHLRTENGELCFTLGNLVSGAMLAGVAHRAARSAVRQNARGISTDDLLQAVERVFQESKDLSHTEQIAAFAEGKHILDVERVYA